MLASPVPRARHPGCVRAATHEMERALGRESGSARAPRTAPRKTDRTKPRGQSRLCPARGSCVCSSAGLRALRRAARQRILATPMDRNNKSDENAFVIKADDDIAKGRFSNFAQVGSTPDAFVLDFSFVQGPAGWLLSRIML